MQEERIAYETDKERIRKEMEVEKDKREAVDFEQYKKLKGLPKDYKAPFERVKEFIKKHQQESKRK